MLSSRNYSPMLFVLSCCVLFVLAIATASSAITCTAPAIPTSDGACTTTGADPVNCTGYKEPRVFLESQAWWQQTPGKSGTDFGHLHEGTCFPVNMQTLSGKIPFDVKVMLHENPGKLDTMKIWLFGNSFNIVVANKAISYSCSTEDCTYWFHLEADTTKIPYDGIQEFRFHVRTLEPDGVHLLATTGWRAYIKNGKSVNSYQPDRPYYTEGRGWYEEVKYFQSRFTSIIPLAPVSGIWKFNIKLARGSGAPGPSTSHSVRIDPSFHADPPYPGIVVREATGEYSGSISVDTTKLSNGRHRLMLKTDYAVPEPSQFAGSTLSGVQTLMFDVKN